MINLNKAEELFDKAIKLPAADREEYLQTTCSNEPDLYQTVMRMVRDFQDASVYFKNLKISWSNDFDHSGSLLGAYKVKDLIGEGGMGKIYLGERNDGLYEQEVAIKVLKIASGNSNQVDQKEQQILANLNHPNIAKIYNAGKTSNNELYLVMELVQGLTIDQYVFQHNLNNRQIGNLMLNVCNAVRHAHQHRVIHRDLKPSNILIDDKGNLKLLDFGISILDKDLEESNFQHILTPNYCAPEQIEGSNNISVTTDVYQLGLLFYSLLCKNPPFQLLDLSHEERKKIIAEKSPPHLKDTIDTSNALVSDYDLIIQKALCKNQEDRYQSVDTFMSDIKAALLNYPLTENKNTGRILLKKFLLRNSGMVVAAASLVIILISFTAFYTVNLNREKYRTNQELLKATATKNFLIEILQANDPVYVDPDTVTLASTLRYAENNISDQFSQQPYLKNDIYELLADIYISQGNYDRLAKVLDEQAQIINVANHQQRAEYLIHNMRLTASGKEVDVAKNVDSIFTLSSELPEIERFRLVSAGYQELGLSKRQSREFEDADSLFKLALHYHRKTPEFNNKEALTILNNIAEGRMNQGKHQECIALYDSLIPFAQQILPEGHPYFATYFLNKGSAYSYLEQQDSAIFYYEKALDLNEERLGKNHPMILFTKNNLASIYLKTGDTDKAKEYYNTIIAVGPEVLNPEHTIIAFAHTAMGKMLTEEKQYKKAEDHIAQALNILPEESWFHGLSQSAMAVVYQNTNRLKKASSLHDEAYKKVSSQRGPEDMYTRRVLDEKTNFRNTYNQ